MRPNLARVMGCVLTALLAEWYSPEALAYSPLSAMTIGETIGRYRIVERLGTGGMGVVYRAEDLQLHRPVALKFLPSELAADDERRARFLREARMAAALNHPNTCTVYEVGELQDHLFIAMELIDGETLAARLSRSGRLTLPEILDIGVQVAEGLTEAHRRQIVHRDLKPHNVMVTPSGRVKILDFGLAKPLQTVRSGGPLTTSELISADLGHTTIIGTCSYMSPEQALGRPVDQRSDIFAFGILLYELIAGERPFQGDTTTEVLAKVIEAEPRPLSSLAPATPANLVSIVARCLQKKPEGRYADTRDLLTDIQAAHRQRKPRETRRGAREVFAVRGAREAVGAIVALLLAVPITFSLVYRSENVREIPPLTGRNVLVIPPVLLAGPAQSSDMRGARAKDGGGATTGQLAATSAPISTVAIDGRLAGITPLTVELAPGTHDVVMTTPDGLRWRGRIAITVGQSLTLHRDLHAVGTLAVVADVWAEVSLDGGPAEQTPIQFERVAAGLHELRVFRDGYVPQRLEIMVEDSKVTSVPLTLVRQP